MPAAREERSQISHGWLDVSVGHSEEFGRGQQAHGPLNPALLYGQLCMLEAHQEADSHLHGDE